MLWTIVNVLTLFVLAVFAYLLWRKTQNKVGSFGIGDLTNMATLVVAIFSLYVAVAAYQKSVNDSEEQQKSLDASRKQLKAVVDSATKQQGILSQNLETSKAQQELLSALLSRSVETAKIQQEIQHKHLEISKAELGVLEAQQKREAELQARKPIAEIALQSSDGRLSLNDLEKQPAIEF